MILTEEQEAAVSLVANHMPPLCCWTGGPGTGKSATLKALLSRLQGKRVALAAPSGKAAQRMEEATGKEAKTLHRLMKLHPGALGPEPIRADVLVVDESSMITSSLLAQAMRAAKRGGVQTVLLVGDADQLPPVGPGCPFQNLLTSKVCPTVRLTKIHRQAEESGIVRAAHEIVRGIEPSFNEVDFQLVETPEAQHVPAAIWDLVCKEGLSITESQVLAPQRNTACGVEEINRYMEEQRVKAFSQPELAPAPVVRGSFRSGTKVLHTENDYDLGVFNGEIGFVREATPGEVIDPSAKGKRARRLDELRVEIAGGVKLYKGSAIRMLKPAWCLSVHKSQGSQWDDVIVVCHRSHTRMNTRRLLYVATTRAAKRVWVVGTRSAVAKAVRNVQDAKRETWLARNLAREVA